MSQQDIEVVKQTYAAFARGDIETVLAAFDPDIEWVEPEGYFPGARGTHHGVEAVRRIFSVYPTHWDEFAADMEQYIDAGEHVIAIGRARFRPKGSDTLHSSQLANVWTMRDGKAVRLQVFNDTALIWRALGGGEEYWAEDA